MAPAWLDSAWLVRLGLLLSHLLHSLLCTIVRPLNSNKVPKHFHLMSSNLVLAISNHYNPYTNNNDNNRYNSLADEQNKMLNKSTVTHSFPSKLNRINLVEPKLFLIGQKIKSLSDKFGIDFDIKNCQYFHTITFKLYRNMMFHV